MSNAKDQSRPCDDCRSSGITLRTSPGQAPVDGRRLAEVRSRWAASESWIEAPAGNADDLVWCHCVFARCSELGFFDAGRGEETHACQLRPGHDGPDHRDGPVSWRTR